MKKTIFILNLFIISLLWSCDDTKETPTPTPTPAKHVNKLTCKINGEFWEALPKKASGILSNPDLTAKAWPIPSSLLKDTVMLINAYNREKQENLSLGFPFFASTIKSRNIDYGPFSGPGIACELDTTKTNKVTIISHDKTKRLLTGSFEFTCYGFGSKKDTLRITDGFFDLQYSY
jgi:hypothetical protein